MSSAPTTKATRVREAYARSDNDRKAIFIYIVRRVLSALGTLFLISVIVFLTVSLLGGDSASVLLGRDATPAALEAARQTLGLDQPLYVRYLEWLGAFVQGDFGATSASQLAGQPVEIADLIAEPLRNSAILAMMTFVIAAPISLWLGVTSGMREGKGSDRTVSSVTLALASLPEFVLATLLTFVFFYLLRLLPPVSLIPDGSSPFERPLTLVLPVLTLALGLLAVTIRQVRAAVIEVAKQPYVQAARLNGYPRSIVTSGFILRNSLAPAVQVLALVLIYLFGGVIVVEQVFAYPGIGNILVRAVTEREIAVLQAVTMIIATLSVTLSLIADLAVLFLVPKLRTSAR
ncbi:ABC transporter permease [Agromyces sp. NPDC058484]|uniref:ABC transporter permease n=1 Tax=Agromyces sp. NPDC058484 TaxID=3346524 RepID=UPI003669ACC2